MSATKPLPLTMSAERFLLIRDAVAMGPRAGTAAELLAELDAQTSAHVETREKLAEADKIIERVGEESNHFCKQADALREQLAQAQKDKERLDLLESLQTTYKITKYGDGWTLFDQGKKRPVKYFAKKLREAIDDAMAALRATKEKA